MGVLAVYMIPQHGQAEARGVPSRSLQDAAAGVISYDEMLIQAMGAPEEAPEEEKSDDDSGDEEDEDSEDKDSEDEEEEEAEEDGDEEPMCAPECTFIPKPVHAMNPRCMGCP